MEMGIPGAPWPASLAQWIPRSVKGPVSKEVEGDKTPLAFTGAQAGAHMCTHIHTNLAIVPETEKQR